MEVQAEADRDFWRGVLVAGGFTANPAVDPRSRARRRRAHAAIPDDLIAALRRLADELAVPLSSVLLAAHAKVLAALSGEREVATGYVGRPGRPAVALRLTTEPDSWRALLLATHRAESELLRTGTSRWMISGATWPEGPSRPWANRARSTGLDRPDRQRRQLSRTPCCGWDLADDGPARAAAAVPDRRARCGRRRPDRRLSPHGAGVDRRRSGCRAPTAEPALRRGAPLPARRAGRTARELPDRRVTSCSSSRWRLTLTPSRPCTAAGSGPTGSSTPAPTGWLGPCWPGGCAAKVSSRW